MGQQKLYAFTLADRLKMSSLSFGGGTADRMSTVRSVDLVLDGTEQIISFDPNQTTNSVGVDINIDGNVQITNDGFYNGDLSMYIDKSGGSAMELAIWVETRPSGGIWALYGDSMANPTFYDDGSYPVAFSGNISGVVGDEFRIKILKISGTGKLTTTSTLVTLGTINNYAASLSLHKLGPKNP